MGTMSSHQTLNFMGTDRDLNELVSAWLHESRFFDAWGGRLLSIRHYKPGRQFKEAIFWQSYSGFKCGWQCSGFGVCKKGRKKSDIKQN